MLAICQEIKEDMVEHSGGALGLTTDHGHRKGQDHFVKLLSWTGRDENDMWTVKFYCLDIDSSGHSAEEAASAIKLSTDDFLELLNEMIPGVDVKINLLTGDSGGGAAAQHIHPVLIRDKTMPTDSRMVNCDMHGIMKPLEIACIETFGKQGIGHRTPFQMVWLFCSILKKVKTEYTRRGLNEMWARVIDKLRNDPKYQKAALENCKYSYEQFMTLLEELESGSDENLDKAIKIVTEAPANTQDPVFSRWGTVMAAVEMFVNHWVVIYFFGQALKEQSKSGSYMWQLSCALLSLMNNKSEPTTDGKSLDDFILSFNADNLNEDGIEDGESKLSQGETPVFEAVLYFLDGFNKAFFQDMYHFLMRDDPFLGTNTFGQLSRFGPERCYVMHKKMSELEGNGWKAKHEFKKFRDVAEGIGTGDYGVEYFEKVTTLFFERFRFVLKKHMIRKWLSDSLIVLVFGGDPHHAQCLTEWLVHYEEHVRHSEEDEFFPYEFPNKEVTLGHHHQMSEDEPIKVNLRDSMAYITSEIDREIVMKDPFIIKNWNLIKELAEVPQVVHLFDKTEDGKAIDKSSWGGVDFAHLVVSVLTDLIPLSNHQQRCENYVQLSGLLSKTGVGEVRRSCRVIMIGAIIRRFNSWALQEKHKMHAKEGKTKVKRLQGSDKTFLFLNFITGFFKRSDKAKQAISNDRYKKICDRIRDSDKKSSAVERSNKLKVFERVLVKNFTINKAELATGIDITARIGGGVYLRILTKTNKMEDVVLAEIRARKIKVTKKVLDSLTIAEQKKLLKEDEFKERRATQELKLADIIYIKPVSEELKRVLYDGIQQQILDKQANILVLETD